MIDYHTHIIPFVDDGSKSIEASIDMIRDEIDNGVDTIYCTPHHINHRYMCSVEVIKENFNRLKEAIKENNLNVNIYLGQEICYTDKVDIIKMLKKGELLTLNNTNYVLLEFSFSKEPDDLYDIIYNFSVNGYKVIVAHIERYDWITIDKVKGLKEEGAIIQVNSGSIVGLSSKKEKSFSKKLLRLDLVDIIASDIHSFRPSTMAKAMNMVKKNELFGYKI